MWDGGLVTSVEEDSSLWFSVVFVLLAASWGSLLPEDFTGCVALAHLVLMTHEPSFPADCVIAHLVALGFQMTRAFLGIMENSLRGLVVSASWPLWLPVCSSVVRAILLGWHLVLFFFFFLPFLTFLPFLLFFPPNPEKSFVWKKRVLLGKYSHPLFYEWVTWCRGGLFRVPQWGTGRVEAGAPGVGPAGGAPDAPPPAWSALSATPHRLLVLPLAPFSFEMFFMTCL